MRRTVALTILIGVLAVGCGSAHAISGPPARSKPKDGPTSGPSKNGPSIDKPNRVIPRPGMSDLHKIDWLRAKRGGQGRSVLLTYWSGVEPCSVLDHVDVVYRSKAIVLTLWEGFDPDRANEPCPEIAVLNSVHVRLRDGTDDWPLRDGAQ
jgi:hypothetical protein